MTISTLVKQLITQQQNGNGMKNGGDRRKPDVAFSIGKELEAAVWLASHRTTGERSCFYDVRRVKGDEKLKTLRASDLIGNAVALALLAERFAKHDHVDPTLQRDLELFAQGFGQLVIPQSLTSEGDTNVNDPFADVAAKA